MPARSALVGRQVQQHTSSTTNSVTISPTRAAALSGEPDDRQTGKGVAGGGVSLTAPRRSARPGSWAVQPLLQLIGSCV
eukprot:1159559-Pelagomonas_calceolata.AAC.4